MAEPSPVRANKTGGRRVLATLKTLANYPNGASIDAIAKQLDSPKSSVHRALQVLQQEDLVQQSADDRKYYLSLSFVHLAFLYYESLDIPARVQPVLARLSIRYHASCHYARLEGNAIVYLSKISPPPPGIHMSSTVGGRNPAHCTGLGKALLAYTLHTRADIDDYIATYGPLERRTVNTITDPDAFHAELEATRRRGFAIDDEESEIGLCCIAAPVYLSSPTRPDGAISVTTVSSHTTTEQLVATVDEFAAIIKPIGGHVSPHTPADPSDGK